MTEVNDWSSNHTGGRIPILINRASDLTGIEQVAVLINALYFNGKWVHPFEEKHRERLVLSNWAGFFPGPVHAPERVLRIL
jgi:Serine protease inhibitor